MRGWHSNKNVQDFGSNRITFIGYLEKTVINSVDVFFDVTLED